MTGEILEASNLFTLSFNPLEYGLERAIRKSALLTTFFIVFVSTAKTFGAEIKGIAEWFVDACEDISTGHEDLRITSAYDESIEDNRVSYPFKSSAACPGMGSNEDWFGRHDFCVPRSR